jgi:DNA-binding response OmpR family regulator
MIASGTLLVVGDTPSGLGPLTLMLAAAGYEVRAVTDSARALSALTVDQPDLVLLDSSGLGMDAVDICRRLKVQEEGRRIPVILIGPRSNDDWRLAGLLAGAAGIIERPFGLEELLACVRLHLELRRLQVALEVKTDELRRASDVLRCETITQACAD